MRSSSNNPRAARAARLLAVLLALLPAACALPPSPTPSAPRATSPAILEITPAPTQNVDATATAYARVLAPTPTPAGLYVVQPGDTLSGLAADFGSTVDEIMAANGLTDPDALQVGQSLIIPSLVQSSPALDAPTATPGIEGTPTATLTATLTLTGTPSPAPSGTASTPAATGTVTTTATISTP